MSVWSGRNKLGSGGVDDEESLRTGMDLFHTMIILIGHRMVCAGSIMHLELEDACCH